MTDVIMAMILGAGLTIVVGLVLWALAEERAEARDRAKLDARPGRHSLEARTRRLPQRRSEDFMVDTAEGLVRPYVED